MSIGIIFCFLTPGYNSEMSTYLFGNILTITIADIVILATISLILLGITVIFHRQIVLMAFDSQFAHTRGINVNLLQSVMMLATAVTIVATLRLVGVVLVMSMLTVPQMTALLFTNSYGKSIALSILIGYASTLLGLILSYNINVPSGATIILCSIVIYFFSRIAKGAIKAQ